MAFTYFFRDMQTLDLIARHVAPHISGRSHVEIWDAGCASGQEPYSLAIMLAENMGTFAFRNINIWASDFDGSGIFGKIIEGGVYPCEELSRIPEILLKKYFTPVGGSGVYVVKDEIRSRVKFIRHDLLSLKPPRESFDMVVCKNVLLHFDEKVRGEVVRMFHGSLAAGGFLATEQTQKLPPGTSDLFSQVIAECQLYRKVDRPN